MVNSDRSSLVGLIVGAICFSTASVCAQIIPDHSLNHQNSIVTPKVTVQDALADLIEGGAIRGNNLFHSFSEFNVSEGGRVYFANPDGIANILTRVTGNNLSEIFGTLGVDGAANLFLLNPNGIVFGKDAALDVNGSFLATTADSFVFNNGFQYSASNPEQPPLLTINIPVGLQFGNQAETIVNQSQSGLQVQPQQNLSLIGANLFLEGGTLQAPTGRIELGSVTPNSRVNIHPDSHNWTLDYSPVQTFQNISLTNNALVGTSGNGGGDININGRHISLSQGSSLESNTTGNHSGGAVNLNATESINLTGVGTDENPSGIFAQVLAQGDGSQVNLTSKSLRLEEGAKISTEVFNSGKGGNVSIQAQDIEIITTNLSDFQSTVSLSVREEGTGDGGDLKINADRLFVKDSKIFVDSFGAGNAGNAIFNIRDIEVTGSSGLIRLASHDFGSGSNFVFNGDQFILSNQAYMDANSYGEGDSGNIEINTRQLQLKDSNSQISVAGWSTGKIGNLTVRASESVEISDIGVLPLENDQLGLFSSGIFTSVESGANTNGGTLIIETPFLKVSDGGRIAANLVGSGTGGNIFIRANTIEVIGTVVDDIGSRSGITTVVEPSGTGTGGNIDILADNLRLINGGSIFVDSKGTGASGNLNIQADNIEVDGISSGEDIELDSVVFPQQPLPSQISALSNTDFAAGNLIIKTNHLSVRNGGLISVGNTKLGDAGNLDITAETIRLENGGILNAEVNTGSQGNLNLTTDNIFLTNNSEITARATGTATGGNITINNTDNIVLLENSQILADAVKGNGGDINITTQGLFVSTDSLISASSQFGLDGRVKIEEVNGDRFFNLDQLPQQPLDTTQRIAQSCSTTADNNFAITGISGLPDNPLQNLRSTTLWDDLRLADSQIQPEQDLSLNNHSEFNHFNNQAILVEAQQWQLNERGNVVLVANSSLTNSVNPWSNYHNCFNQIQ